MGVAQSSEPRRNRGWNQDDPEDIENDLDSAIVRIELEDIPEEYRTVSVSQDVIRRVNQQAQQNDPFLSTKLKQQTDENEALKKRVAQLQEEKNHLQKSGASLVSAPQQSNNFDEETVRERKRIFDETVSSLEKQFFNPLKASACVDEENAILQCLNKNPNRVLYCKPLLFPYKNCIEKFRERVIEEERLTSKS